jgi:uncharacterized protein YjbI with pentapeptide repeats
MKKMIWLFITLLATGVQGCKDNVRPLFEKGDWGSVVKHLKKGEYVLIENTNFKEDVDFTVINTPTLETEGMSRVYIAGGVTFRNCNFLGKVIANKSDNKGETRCCFEKNLTFSGCSFEQEVNFKGLDCRGLAEFRGCTFLKRTVFEDSRFAVDGDWAKCNFKAPTRFLNCFFGRRATFSDATFDTTAIFQSAIFKSDAQFANTKIYGYADFAGTAFDGHAFFNYAEFRQAAVFNQAAFRGRCEFMHAEMKSGSFIRALFYGDTRFDDAKVDAKLDFSKALFVVGKPGVTGLQSGSIGLEEARVGGNQALDGLK